jgi:DNA-binding GntR family transcriptional regulator
MILSGELRPGEKLTEMALAARLGVSRGPLREAFRMLDESGLVRTEKNRGVFVRDLPVAEAIEIFDLRARWTSSSAAASPSRSRRRR